MSLPTVVDEPTEPPGSVADQGRRRFLLGAGAAALAVAAGAVVVDVVRRGRPPSPPGSWTVVPHTGLGAWVDAYDWTVALGGATPGVGPKTVRAMADAGVQTLYVQTAHQRSPADVMEPDRLDDLIDSAHSHHMHVVAWYLPTFLDVSRDVARLTAAADLKIDGLGVDIESLAVPDEVERNRRVVDLTRRVRTAVGRDKALAAITLSPVHLQLVNPSYWPGYPWPDLGPAYDVIMPMSYWTLRRGELRSGVRIVGEDISRVRASAGAEVAVHSIGGVADRATAADIGGMVTAIQQGGAIGGSLYDWRSSTAAQWAALRPLRKLRR